MSEAGVIHCARALAVAEHLKPGRHCVLDPIPPQVWPSCMLLHVYTHTLSHTHTHTHMYGLGTVNLHMHVLVRCQRACATVERIATSPLAAVFRVSAQEPETGLPAGTTSSLHVNARTYAHTNVCAYEQAIDARKTISTYAFVCTNVAAADARVCH
jgi:hypothetical protein